MVVSFWNTFKYLEMHIHHLGAGQHIQPISLVSCLWFEMFTADRFCLSGRNQSQSKGSKLRAGGEKAGFCEEIEDFFEAPSLRSSSLCRHSLDCRREADAALHQPSPPAATKKLFSALSSQLLPDAGGSESSELITLRRRGVRQCDWQLCLTSQ